MASNAVLALLKLAVFCSKSLGNVILGLFPSQDLRDVRLGSLEWPSDFFGQSLWHDVVEKTGPSEFAFQ